MRALARRLAFNAVLAASVGLLATDKISAAGPSRTSSLRTNAAVGATTAKIECDHRTVRCSVIVNNNPLAPANSAPRSFRVREVWRYAPDTKQWLDVTPRNILPVAILATRSRGSSPLKGSQVLFEFPQDIGLYHLRWMEDGQRYEGTAFVGPFLCNDVLILEPPPPGTYAGCWPLARGAMAGYVPNPPPPRD